MRGDGSRPSPRRKPGPIAQMQVMDPGFRRGDEFGRNGFSLIEVMVALAIFGLAAVALIRLQGVSLASANTLSDRGQAAIVARNQALEAWISATPPGPASGTERAGRRNWAWTRQTSPGPDPGSIRIAVSVAGDSGQIIASDQLLWVRR